eukprot:444324-Rhodomonas_salina.5
MSGTDVGYDAMPCLVLTSGYDATRRKRGFIQTQTHPSSFSSPGMLSSYALATESPVLTSGWPATVLGACYGQSGTDGGYAGTSGRNPYRGKHVARVLVLRRACSIAKKKVRDPGSTNPKP